MLAPDLPEWDAFRKNMRKRRRDLGLSQAEVSTIMGIDRRTLIGLENGSSRGRPNMTTVWLWTAALNGTVEVIWK